MKTWIFFVVLITASIRASAQAAEEPASDQIKVWEWSASVGVSDWGSLEKIEAIDGGHFKPNGFSLELAAHKSVSRWGNTRIFVGIDLGFVTTASNIAGQLEELTQRAMYLTPSLKFSIDSDTYVKWYLEAGAGWYSVDLAELDCSGSNAICGEIDVPFSSNTVGGYLGIRARMGRHFFASLRAHQADFGRITGIDTIDAELDGPIYQFALGGAF